MLAIEPEDIKSLTNKGLELNLLGNYEDATKYFDQVLAIEPENTIVQDEKDLALKALNTTK